MENKKYKLLVVDDDSLNRKFMYLLLTKKNFDVFLAENANETLTILKKELIDLIFMDICMPEINGFELTKLIRLEKYNIPVIGVSAYFNDNQVYDIFECGMDEYIPKPINVKLLDLILQKFLKSENI